MFNSVVDLVATSDWPYVVVLAVAALDAVFPLVPSEATVITAGAIAASGRLSLIGVLAVAAAGAFIGDNVGYAVGRLSAPGVRRLSRSPAGQRRLLWAEDGLARRGATVIVVSRFIPGGRTATMLAAGVTHFRWQRFACLDAIAVVLWASYAAMLGFVGGVAFRDTPLYAVALALGLAVGLTIVFEGGRRFRRGRSRSRSAGNGDSAHRSRTNRRCSVDAPRLACRQRRGVSPVGASSTRQTPGAPTPSRGRRDLRRRRAEKAP